MGKYFKEGLGKVLGPLELEVLEVLWKRGAMSGREVFSAVRLSRDIAKTTIFTVLERLFKKGLISKKKGSEVYIFRPVYDKERFARKVSHELLKGAFELSAVATSVAFVDMLADMRPVEIERLSTLIERKKKMNSKRRKITPDDG